MLKVIGEWEGTAKALKPGDIVTVKQEPTEFLGRIIHPGFSYSKKIEIECEINRAGIFEFENEFGLAKGVGGYFGEK